MSATPRTDSNCFAIASNDPQSTVVWADFTRELERENAELREQLAQMRSVINEMADRFGRPEFKTRLFDDFMRMRRDLRRDSAYPARAKEAKMV